MPWSFKALIVAMVASTDMAFLPQVIITAGVGLGFLDQGEFRTRLEPCRSGLVQ